MAKRKLLGFLIVGISVWTVLSPHMAQSQTYPTKPVRVIVPFSPGGTTDIVSRVVAQKLGEIWRRQLVVENRGGAGGAIGTEAAARSAPDGYTIVIGHVGTLAMNPTLNPRLSYDPLKDLAPITLLAVAPNGLVVHPSLPVKSVSDLIKLAKRKPNDILYASAGSGSSTHLATVYFALLANIKMTHVPYKGTGPALIDLVAGRTSMMIPGLPPIMNYVKAGRLRLLAVTSGKRVPIFPNTPTVSESGLPEYVATNWLGFLAPAGTPPAIMEKLNSGIREALRAPQVRSRLEQLGLEVAGGSQREFRDLIAAEIKRWAPVIKASGARVN